ncbi:RrF2 family transcriptional regulator [Micromonospora sp. NPDC049900]|uniref:RrF2 family transcriptional regulator n=1 Tax=Micromonospora sp. NPDC049900 TaxID=3364275 RepID=UPI003797C6D8
MMALAAADQDTRPVRSSAELAEALDINPVLVRRLTAPLIRAGLLTSTHGRNGGLHLATPPDRITLRDIYLAAVGDKPLWDNRRTECQSYLNTGHGREFLTQVHDQAEEAILQVLASHTLASCHQHILGTTTAQRPGVWI